MTSDAKFRKQLETSTTVYSDVMQVVRQARRLANKYDNMILHSEAITHVINHTLPDKTLLTKNNHDYDAQLLKEAFCYIDDQDICNAVYDSFYESNKRKNLIYIYNGITDESIKSRVRVITRMLWYQIYPYKGDDNMANNVEIKNTDVVNEIPKAEKKPRKRRIAKKSGGAAQSNTVKSKCAEPTIASEDIPTIESNSQTDEETIVKPSQVKRYSSKKLVEEDPTIPKSENIEIKENVYYGKKAMHTDHIRLYKTSVAKTPFSSYHGDFYLWSVSVDTPPLEQYGRSPITDNEYGIGTVSSIIGWVNLSEV